MRRACRSCLALLILGGASRASGQWTPDEAERAMQPADGLLVRLFASEPAVVNPTAIDVDAQGRVWVCEGVNYRRAAGPQSPEPPYFLAPQRKSGDRIVILEDTDADGVSDKSTVFYEGLDIQSPLGIAVIGGKVWISQSPTLCTIEIGPDGRAGKKETVLTGFGGLNSDHGTHSVYVGPDGKLYGCFGNEGAHIAFPDGRRLDTDGKPWWGGCAWRANLDLTGLEVLGHNFRNNYECATDSFGTTFMSDNDDDGNQWVRMTYVMEGGDFGYLGPDGRHWTQDGGSHYHMENPGVVPCILRTGAGAPCGMCIYEGAMLPDKYRGMPLHVDAGPAVLQCFRVTPDGAGYRVAGAAADSDGRQTVETLSRIRRPDILLASKDRWFRPSDVCVAPDGSLFVADWYDPGVGGHAMRDATRGRVYRVTVPGREPYCVPKVDVRTSEGLIAALASPCVATRTLAILRIRELGAAARSILEPAADAPDRILRARVMWQLGMVAPDAQVRKPTVYDRDPDFAILAIRSRSRSGAELTERSLFDRKDASVRRELLLASRHADAADPGVSQAIVELANQYDGHDRFYLEAVGIAFRGREDTLVPALIKSWNGRWDRTTAGLFWELRPRGAVEHLAKLASDAGTAAETRLEALKSLGGLADRGAAAAMLDIAAAPGAIKSVRVQALRILAERVPGPWRGVLPPLALSTAVGAASSDPDLRAAAEALSSVLGARPLTRWRLSPSFPSTDGSGLDHAYPPESTQGPDSVDGFVEAAVEADGRVNLLAQRRAVDNRVVYADLLLEAREAVTTRLLVTSDDSIKIWLNGTVVHRNAARRGAASLTETVAVGFSKGLNRLLVKIDHLRGGKGFRVEVEDLEKMLAERDAKRPTPPDPVPADHLDAESLPPEGELAMLSGDAARGRSVFFSSRSTCSKCHTLQGEGVNIGPDLSSVGVKAGKDALLRSILKPSDAIAPEYVQWVVTSEDTGTVGGLLMEDGAQRVVLKDASGRTIVIPTSSIQSKTKSDVSLMPEGLVFALTLQELADLVQYLSEQK